MPKWVSFLVLVFLTLLSLPACRPTEPDVPLEPTILILSPAMNSVLSPGPVTVKTYTQNVKLVDKAGQANVPGEGHLIFYIDMQPPVTLGEPAIPDSGAYAISTNTRYTWPELAPGDHILAVQVVNNDNTPIRYPTAVRVNITVR